MDYGICYECQGALAHAEMKVGEINFHMTCWGRTWKKWAGIAHLVRVA